MLEQLESQLTDVKQLVDLTPGPNSPVAQSSNNEHEQTATSSEEKNTSFKQESSDITSHDTPMDFWDD